MRTDFRDSFLLQKLNRSSRLGPSRSITRTLYSPSTPNHFTFGIPVPPCRILYNFDSYNSCGNFVLTFSSLIATSSLFWMLVPR
uniref:Casein kinase I-like n=1 Tax=Rhizophora mucronata TaxID=61149 RepID=A0A2P2M2R9_RHIMU